MLVFFYKLLVFGQVELIFYAMLKLDRFNQLNVSSKQERACGQEIGTFGYTRLE